MTDSMGLRLYNQGRSPHQLLGEFFYRKGGQTWEWVSGGCIVSILGDIQNLTGHSPKQSARSRKLILMLKLALL